MNESKTDAIRIMATRLYRHFSTEKELYVEKLCNMVHFPTDCCDHASFIVGWMLLDDGFSKLQIIKGEAFEPQKFHRWIECEGVVIDITASQFGQAEVIVTRESAWHSATWEIKNSKLFNRDYISALCDPFNNYGQIYEQVRSWFFLTNGDCQFV